MTDAAETLQLSFTHQPPVNETCGVLAVRKLRERTVVQPAAKRNGRTGGPRSEHARGHAIDVAGFTPAGGPPQHDQVHLDRGAWRCSA